MQNWDEERRASMVRWLHAHGVDPDKTFAVDVNQKEGKLQAWCYKYNDEGKLYLVDDDVAREEKPILRDIIEDWEYPYE